MIKFSEVIKQYDSKFEDVTVFGAISFFASLIVSALLIFNYFTIDVFNFRPINKIIIKNEVEVKNVLDMMKQVSRYEDIDYNYSKEVRSGNYTISGVAKIEKIKYKQYDKEYNIISEKIYEGIYANQSGLKLSLWTKEIDNIKKLPKGTEFQFTGTLNGINKGYIIISEANIR